MNRFKVSHWYIRRTKSFGILFKRIPPALKEKYATQTEPGHWRAELSESFEIFLLCWKITIMFRLGYWNDWCEKKNKENGYYI